MAAPQLSTEANRLLAYLRAEQAAAARAGRDVQHFTDEHLASVLHLHPRVIIDAAKELLVAGVLALADGKGRWIGTTREALDYSRTLKSRGCACFERRAMVTRALATNRRQARGQDDTGQLNLFPAVANQGSSREAFMR
jgi:hypothetical protein